MKLVQFVLRRPYTVIVGVILLCIMGVGAALRMPIDIFPEINIPVVSVVWTYAGMTPLDIQNRILTLHERQLASLVDDISRIEATSYYGVGVEKVYLHEGADVTRAVAQLASSALVVLKYMPANITPPLVLRYGATDVPIIQLGLSSTSLTDTTLNDLGQNTIRPYLAVVHGAQVPYPYGGKPRVIMVDLDQLALEARGLSASDVASALQQQNVILPSGDVKIGSKDYTLATNNSPDAITAINQFPVKEVAGRIVFVRDVAHVHDGYQIQTNSVAVDSQPGALMMVRKTGGVSTLAVIDGIKNALPYIKNLLPRGVDIKPIFDQSVFVKAALNSVLMGGMMAAGLTALMILLFLGDWRLTLIILASIPLSIVTAVIVLYAGGQALNTMTLGGFALAVGILVDNGTVVIENIERHVKLGEPLTEAIVTGCGEVGVPTMLSTLSISIVFVPVFLLQGTAKYLFSPMSLSVCVALIASLGLSFTLVPVLFQYLMRSSVERHQQDSQIAPAQRRRFNPLTAIHLGFEAGFNRFRESYRSSVAFCVAHSGMTSAFFFLLIGCSLPLFPQLGRDFFPQVDAGQMRLHVRAPPGTRIEKTQSYFAEVEKAIRQIVGQDQIDVLLDNIGLPYSGINIALSDSATVGTMDGEILISLKKKHSPTPPHVADLRRELPRRFPELQFFFQPADIVDQVLNFGLPAPIDIRVSGPNSDEDYGVAEKITQDISRIPGVVDSHVFQVPHAPALTIDVDRVLAQELGISEEEAIRNVLVTTNSSGQTSPNFWVDPKNSVSYLLAVQSPTYRVNSAQDLWTVPITPPGTKSPQMLMNIAKFGRTGVPIVASQFNIMPVFDVQADVQGRDLASAATDIEKVLGSEKHPPAIKVTLSGQVETMLESYNGLFSGMAFAVVLVYLILVINFQSWIDPLIVIMALPFALAGVIWMLFLTGTHLSVPALMGALMSLGLATANSILVVTFANQRMEAGDESRTAAIIAGFTRLRPVLMTAGAMILGMIPMALGVGEGGEQNAPLARAVIGGLLFATFATLIFVPVMYRILRKRSRTQINSAASA
ncbi:MAG: Multidrug resistance protein MdtC [Beijerinckiaceae bacterium]|nr:MAG: Multidrug resistance protein MdtC [Beijerinckiaceae bacterium]